MAQTVVTNATRNSRIEWVDAAKGLGIALIVIGHVFSAQEPSLFYQYLYAFHVPLFFFVTGVTIQVGKNSLPQLVKKKLQTLLIPYVCYALLGYFFYLAGYFLNDLLGRDLDQFRYGLSAPLLGILWGTVGSGNLVNSPVWFLPALFWATLLTHEVNRHIPHPAARLTVLLVLTALGCMLAESVELPMSFVPALLALPFLQAGLMHRIWLGRLASKASYALLMLIAALVFAFSPVNGFSMQSETVIGNPWLFYLFAFAGIALVIGCLLTFGFASRWLAKLGHHSLAIMVVHMLVIKSVQVVLSAMFGLSFQALMTDVHWGLLVLLIVAVSLMPLVWLIETWLPSTLGKPGKPSSHG